MNIVISVVQSLFEIKKLGVLQHTSTLNSFIRSCKAAKRVAWLYLGGFLRLKSTSPSEESLALARSGSIDIFLSKVQIRYSKSKSTEHVLGQNLNVQGQTLTKDELKNICHLTN